MSDAGTKAVDRLRKEVDLFAHTLQQRDAKAADLLGPRTELEQSPQMLRRALDELRYRHEELLVAEEELRAQLEALVQSSLQAENERQRYVDLFASAPDPVVVTDLGGVIRDANPAAVDLLAVQLRFLRARPILGYVAGTKGPVRDTLADLVGSGGSTASVACVVKPRGGSAFACTAHVAVTARRTRLLWTFRRPQAAAERTGDLERALRDTKELLERERAARDDLARTDEAKDRFIAVLAHDLRSPLDTILGWTQLLRRELLDGAARKRAFETIERNALAQAGLIDELLDISRMAADRFHLELAPVDLAALVRRIVEGSVPTAAARQIMLRFVGPQATATMMGDAPRLEQIVTNLLANALKFTPATGAVSVVVVAGATEVELMVHDTGRGIPASLVPRLFDLYAQEHDHATPEQGLGLGLYIVKRLAELQHGRVRAESAGEGAGATFVVSFPIRNDHRTTSSPASPPATTCALDSLRVLVVDDDVDARELTATVLRRARAEVRCASSTAGALELLVALDFDVVISDLALPGADGTSLVRSLRERDAKIAAIALSGFASERDIERALAAGFDAHLAKPCGPAELVDAVSRAAQLRDR